MALDNNRKARIVELCESSENITAMLKRYGAARVYYPVEPSWVRAISKATGCCYKYDDENKTLWFATKDMAQKGVDMLDKKALDNLIDLNLLAFRATESVVTK